MAGIKDYSTSAGSNNAAPPNGAPEGMAPSYVNDVIRQVMADIRTQFEAGMWFDHGITPAWVSSASFKLSTDLTAVFNAGRPVELYGSTMGTAYSQVKSSTYVSPVTTVTLEDSAVGSTVSQVRYSLLAGNKALPRDVGNLSVSGSLAVSGGLTVSGNAALSTLTVPGNATVSGVLTLKNSLSSEIATYARLQFLSSQINPNFASSATASINFTLSDSITFTPIIQVAAYDLHSVGNAGSGYKMSYAWTYDQIGGAPATEFSFSGVGGYPTKYPIPPAPVGSQLAVKIFNGSGAAISSTLSVVVRIVG